MKTEKCEWEMYEGKEFFWMKNFPINLNKEVKEERMKFELQTNNWEKIICILPVQFLQHLDIHPHWLSNPNSRRQPHDRVPKTMSWLEPLVLLLAHFHR